MNRPDPAAGIAGLCFLACLVVIPALAYASALFRTYGPILREAILATLTPQFGAGMLFMLLLMGFGALIFAYGESRR